MDLELIRTELNKMDHEYWANKYINLKLAIEEFNNNRTIGNELHMRELEKDFYISEARFSGYTRILNGEEVGDVKGEIDKLNNDFMNLKIATELKRRWINAN